LKSLEEQARDKLVRNSKLLSVFDYEEAAKLSLSEEVRNYIYRGTESESTLRRNEEAFSRYLLRRRVLHGIVSVKTEASYFDGRIRSEIPFFPSSINVSPLYPNALLDILRLSKKYYFPIFVSHLALGPSLEIPKLPSLVPQDFPLLWQIYFETNNKDRILKDVSRAKEWGYKGITITVDTEQNVKLGYEVPKQLMSESFLAVTPKEIREVRERTSLPLIVKGLMTPEDSELAVESGADGVVVSNHGGRTLDEGEATIEALPKIAKHLKGKRATRRTEIFVDGGIRKGTSILKALALGARGCLIGRPIFWGLAVNRAEGASNVIQILRSELTRAAILCGVKDTSKVSGKILVKC
jgi:4-hydroxymandelate oxidase